MDLSNKSVLLAEDDKAAQSLCGAYFKKMWIEKYDIAEDWQEAINLAKKNLYDVIIMDIRLPIIDGIEATKQIRETKNWNAKIISCTAYGKIELVDLFDLNLIKPLSMKDFTNAILYVLNTNRKVKTDF